MLIATVAIAVFADIVNVLLFDGERVISEDSLTDAQSATCSQAKGMIPCDYAGALFWHGAALERGKIAEKSAFCERKTPAFCAGLQNQFV